MKKKIKEKLKEYIILNIDKDNQFFCHSYSPEDAVQTYIEFLKGSGKEGITEIRVVEVSKTKRFDCSVLMELQGTFKEIKGK